MNQRGFSLLSAIFLIVVIAALGVFMVTLSGTQHFTTLLSLKGAQAYNASRAGLEWGVYQALVVGSCAGSTPLTLTHGGVSGFSVTVTCSSSTHTEAGDTFNIYAITAFASSGTLGQADYVSRRMRTVVSDAP